jgi:hypothetical protein
MVGPRKVDMEEGRKGREDDIAERWKIVVAEFRVGIDASYRCIFGIRSRLIKCKPLAQFSSVIEHTVSFRINI